MASLKYSLAISVLLRASIDMRREHSQLLSTVSALNSQLQEASSAESKTTAESVALMQATVIKMKQREERFATEYKQLIDAIDTLIKCEEVEKSADYLKQYERLELDFEASQDDLCLHQAKMRFTEQELRAIVELIDDDNIRDSLSQLADQILDYLTEKGETKHEQDSDT